MSLYGNNRSKASTNNNNNAPTSHYDHTNRRKPTNESTVNLMRRAVSLKEANQARRRLSPNGGGGGAGGAGGNATWGNHHHQRTGVGSTGRYREQLLLGNQHAKNLGSTTTTTNKSGTKLSPSRVGGAPGGSSTTNALQSIAAQSLLNGATSTAGVGPLPHHRFSASGGPMPGHALNEASPMVLPSSSNVLPPAPLSMPPQALPPEQTQSLSPLMRAGLLGAAGGSGGGGASALGASVLGSRSLLSGLTAARRPTAGLQQPSQLHQQQGKQEPQQILASSSLGGGGGGGVGGPTSSSSPLLQQRLNLQANRAATSNTPHQLQPPLGSSHLAMATSSTGNSIPTSIHTATATTTTTATITDSTNHLPTLINVTNLALQQQQVPAMTIDIPRRNSITPSNLHQSHSTRATAGATQSIMMDAAVAMAQARRRQRSRIYDDPAIIEGYNSVPLLKLNRLPRGGLSLDTKAIGRIQFGIPPETIKDSMRLGIQVPRVYIVPVERFSREMGPARGINLAEFEFPTFFNYFIKEHQCTLVVDSLDAEENVRRVFGETFLGPAQFRNHDAPLPNEDEDFDPSFPRRQRPNFYKEFYHFRTAEASTNYEEMSIDTLLEFVHFKGSHTRRSMGASTISGGSGHNHNSSISSLGGVSGAAAAGGGGGSGGGAYFRNSGMDRLGVPPSLHGGGDPYLEGVEEEGGGAATRRHPFLPEGTEELDDSTRFIQDAVDQFIGDRLDDDDYLLDEYGPPDLHESAGDLTLNATSTAAGTGGLGPVGTLRRTMSDPDVRRAALEDLLQSSGPPSEHEHMDRTGNSGGGGGGGPTNRFTTTPNSPYVGRRMSFRRGSLESASSNPSRTSRAGLSWASGASFMLASDDEEDPGRNSWMYSQAKWLGDVATVYPPDATEVQKATNTCARVEIFKMTGGTEYIIHDVDENNIIVGKARFSGTVRVPDEIAVEGFLKNEGDDELPDEDDDDDDDLPEEKSTDAGSGSLMVARNMVPPTFHPPSFGVTVLGNSHGFDSNGSVSGYVLWVNGRGIMIDPPPYSSATLEREGIRPQMIMAIIITHCHADHDAGTFQKVMTGSRVAIITTPTIYKSFIRKYAALSGLSPTLLKHSHRHRPAIIGQPLKFQGATFHFTYTFHVLPCIAFKVEWRGRSMVFSGDHLNDPKILNHLENLGVFTKERADDLRQLPLQDCDVLLHEAGVPPVHTPFKVLEELPEEVKKRLYVVHVAKIPAGSKLRIAPVGTARTIRLDERLPRNAASPTAPILKQLKANAEFGDSYWSPKEPNEAAPVDASFNLDDGMYEQDEYVPMTGSSSDLWRRDKRSPRVKEGQEIPRVFLRPTCVSDAWFILSLLSNVPFLSSLSYANTMEVLEIAQVERFFPNEIVLPSSRRAETLCVVWEGTCVEREPDIVFLPPGDFESVNSDFGMGPILDNLDIVQNMIVEPEIIQRTKKPTVWHAGDWTGPVALQPDVSLSADAAKAYGEAPKDIVALSKEGVKVIMLNMKDLHQILKTGSKLFRKYLVLQEKQAAEEAAIHAQNMPEGVLDYNPTMDGHDDEEFERRERLDVSPANWYEKYDSVLEVLKCNSALGRLTALQKRHFESLAEGPRYFEAHSYLWQVGKPVDFAYLIVAGTAVFASKPDEPQYGVSRRGSTGTMTPMPSSRQRFSEASAAPFIEEDRPLSNIAPNSEYARLEIGLQLRVEEMELDAFEKTQDLLPKEERMRNARDRFANKVLARLYSRRAYTNGLVFSRGHLLSDTSRMVSGSLAHIQHTGRSDSISSMGSANENHHCHTSNMTAGPEGCVVLVFPRSSLVQFLDGYPGVLLSLLGTQVVV